MEQILRDRPAMLAYATKRGAAWNWAVQQFAGAQTGWRIKWCKVAPISIRPYLQAGYLACYIPEKNGKAATITIAKESGGHTLNGELLWASLVFELFNVRRASKCAELLDLAKRRMISREEFIKQITQVEYRAEVERASFYENLWRPEAEATAAKTNESYWHLPMAKSYEQWISQFTSRFSYPWSVYGRIYDDLAVNEDYLHVQRNMRENPVWTELRSM